MTRAAFRAAWSAGAGDAEAPSPIEIGVDTDIPLGRGLGASAASRAAGIWAANQMLGSPLSDAELLALGTRLEGHADNVAPALFGGCQVVAVEGERVERVALPVADGLRFVGFVPRFSMPTQESRELLPSELSRADAVHQSSRSTLLAAALTTGSWGALRTATDDRLHQPPRSTLFPSLYRFIEDAVEAGAWCCYLSGGGSTVMALSDAGRESAVRAAMEATARRWDVDGYSFAVELDAEGTRALA